MTAPRLPPPSSILHDNIAAHISRAALPTLNNGVNQPCRRSIKQLLAAVLKPFGLHNGVNNSRAALFSIYLSTRLVCSPQTSRCTISLQPSATSVRLHFQLLESCRAQYHQWCRRLYHFGYFGRRGGNWRGRRAAKNRHNQDFGKICISIQNG